MNQLHELAHTMQKSFKETSTISPHELLQNGQEYGISGDEKEVARIEERQKIKEVSPYSENINLYIRSSKEAQLYKDYGLKEGIVNDRPVLKDTTIDPYLKDDKGRTNLERMQQGLAPLDENGNSYNLHHIGQQSDSPFAELKDEIHKSNDAILHDKNQESQIDRQEFLKQRAAHWKARAAEIIASLD